MKYLVFSALFFASSFAIGDFSKANCDYIELEDARVLYQEVTNYFFDRLATYKNDAVDGTTLQIAKIDCQMGDDSLAGVNYRVSWTQYPLDQMGAKQVCTKDLLATPTEVFDDGSDPNCLNQ